MKRIALKGLRTQAQTDAYTCGLCAATTVYRYYGLSPRDARLRRSLGVDNHTWLPFHLPLRERLQRWLVRKGLDSCGTLPMDLVAALRRDGFRVVFKTGDYGKYKAELRRHLGRGHPAIALVANLSHWVVIAGMDDKGVLVLDSAGFLDPEERARCRFTMPHDAFSETVCGVLLTSRAPSAQPVEMRSADFAREYARGAAFSAACMAKAVPAWIRSRLPG